LSEIEELSKKRLLKYIDSSIESTREKYVKIK